MSVLVPAFPKKHPYGHELVVQHGTLRRHLR